MTAFDPRDLRTAFGRFMTGVTIVTTRTPDGTPVGFTANSFSSVSLDPPLVLVCPGKFLSSFDLFASAEHFAISVLSEDQQDASNTFAGRSEDRFQSVPHHLDANGIPLIENAIAGFSCRTRQVVPAGDHAILIGEVTDFSTRPGQGLGYADGRYFSLGLEQAANAESDTKQIGGVIVDCLDGVLLEETADGFRPIEVSIPDPGTLRETLAVALAERGIDADIHQVYSAFEDKSAGRKQTYCLGSGWAKRAEPGIRLIPAKDLPGLRYTTPAVAEMMCRYAFESGTGDFSLYLGDALSGALHSTKQRT